MGIVSLYAFKLIFNNKTKYSKMKKNVLLLFAFLLGFVAPMSVNAQTCPPASRQLFNAKAETQYDAIGAALKNLLSDNTNAAWVWESGATFVENSDGTARLQGILRSFQNPTTHRLQVDVTFTGRTFVAPAGSPVLMNTNPSTNGWYYYQWGAASMTGLNNLAGARITLAQRGKALQIGVGAADQVQDLAKLGGSGWFTWTIVSQPTNTAIRINPFPAEPSIDQADLAFTLSGSPTVCTNDPCANVATPTFTNCPTSELAFTAGANGCAIINYTVPTASAGSTVTVESGPASGSCQLVSNNAYTVVFKATSSTCDKIARCTLTIKVNAAVDPCANVATPTFTNCPTSEMAFTAGANGCATINYTVPTASAGSTVTVESGPANGSCQLVSNNAYTVVFKATSSTCDKIARCTLTIKVNPFVNPCATDVTGPVISNCPANQSLTINSDCERVFWTAPTATDACSNPTTLTFVTSPIEGRGNGSCYTPGVTTVTYTATDAKSNKSTCSFTITITTTCSNITDPGTISGDQSLCRSGTLTPINSTRAASGGTGPIEYLWMYSDGTSTFDPTTWTVIPNQTGASLTNFPTLTKTTYFIRCVRNAGCLFYKESNIVTKTISACLQSGSAFQSINLVTVSTHQVRVDWITKNEVDDTKYVIERSYDGINFMEIGEMKSKKQALNMYQYSDMNPKMGRSFYRVKHIESNGALDFSKIKSTVLYANGGEAVATYPNPTTNALFVEILDTDNAEGVIEVYNAYGLLVKTEKFSKSQARYEVNMTNLPTGAYVFKIRQTDGQVKSVKVTKQ